MICERPPAPTKSHQARGRTNYHAGQAAEQIVRRKYEMAGYKLAAKRWRGKSGEIDLVMARDGLFAFIEVKSSKSHDAAAMLLGPRQQARLLHAASDFMAKADPMTRCDVRMDVALVDQCGRTKFLQNAIGH